MILESMEILVNICYRSDRSRDLLLRACDVMATLSKMGDDELIASAGLLAMSFDAARAIDDESESYNSAVESYIRNKVATVSPELFSIVREMSDTRYKKSPKAVLVSLVGRMCFVRKIAETNEDEAKLIFDQSSMYINEFLDRYDEIVKNVGLIYAHEAKRLMESVDFSVKFGWPTTRVAT